TRFQAPCAPLSTGCVSPLRKKVPSDENVRRFFPTPAGRLAVTIHAPTSPRFVATALSSRVTAAQPATTTTANRLGIKDLMMDIVCLRQFGRLTLCSAAGRGRRMTRHGAGGPSVAAKG